MDMRREVKEVTIHENLRNYAVKLVDATRKVAEVSVGASPRALLSLLRCAQAIAYLADRNYCIPEDLAEAAKLTLTHRLVLTAQAKMSHVTKEDILNKILQKITVS